MGLNSTKQSILIRVEGNEVIGYGHFMRCLSLARYVADEFDCTFAMSTLTSFAERLLQEYGFDIVKLGYQYQYSTDDPRSIEEFQFDLEWIAGNFQIVVLDGYRFKAAYCDRLAQVNSNIVKFVDDLSHEDVNATKGVITQIPLSEKEKTQWFKNKRVHSGSDGFLIRPEFFSDCNDDSVKRFDWFLYIAQLESFKYCVESSELKNKKVLALVSNRLVDQCVEVGWTPIVEPDVIELAREMRACKSALLPASTIALEYFVCTGRKPLVFCFAENQNQGLPYFVKRGVWASTGQTPQVLDGQLSAVNPKATLTSFLSNLYSLHGT